MKNIIAVIFAALTLAACAAPVAIEGPTYRGLQHQPPYAPGECLVLGHDNVWRRCS